MKFHGYQVLAIRTCKKYSNYGLWIFQKYYSGSLIKNENYRILIYYWRNIMLFGNKTWLNIGFGLLSYSCSNSIQTEFSTLFTCVSNIQYSLIGSILTFGALIGAITSGPVADYIGPKWVSKKAHCWMLSEFCIS